MPQDILVNGMLWNGVASIDVLGEDGNSVRYYSHGAYYTPTVDEEGNLSWTPVREDMPKIPIANIRGPQGAGGIKKIVDFSISASQWKENSNSDDEYKLYYDFTDNDISEDILLLMVLSDECLEKACCCGLCPTVVSYDGYARIKCAEKPETEMKGTCYLIDETIPMIFGSGSSLSKEELTAVVEEYFKLSELIEKIKANAGSIEQLTNGKVNVADIVNDLITNVANKPLSAAQGVVLKGLVDGIRKTSTSAQNIAAEAFNKADEALVKLDHVEKYAQEALNAASIANSRAENAESKVVDLENVCVRYEPQNMPEDYKAQARANIGVPEQSEIVQAVLESIGTPIFGVVEADNTVILEGDIPEEKYYFKWKMVDGTTVDIGELEFSAGGKYTNLADPTSADWKTDFRLTTVANQYKALTGGVVTNFVSVESGDTIYVEGIDFVDTNNRNAITSKENGTYILAVSSSFINTNGVSDGAYNSNSMQFTITLANTDMKVRFSGIATGTSNDVVIKIKRNGEWL